MTTRNRGRRVQAALRASALAVLALAPAAAHADSLVYVWGAFDAVHSAFLRMALFYAGSNVAGWLGTAVALGLFIAIFMAAANGIFGNRVNPIHHVWIAVLGIAVYLGTVIPKDRVILIDPAQIQIEIIDDVPLLVAKLAWALSTFERTVIQNIDTLTFGGSVTNYSSAAGGSGFELALRAFQISGSSSDRYLDNSLQDYMSKCYKEALNNPLYNTNFNELRSGMTRMRTELAKAGNIVSVFTLFYTEDEPLGIPLTCEDAWNTGGAGEPGLAARLDAEQQFFREQALNACRAQGRPLASGIFSSPAIAEQACLNQFAAVMDNYFQVPADALAMFEHLYLLKQFRAFLLESSPDRAAIGLANAQFTRESLGIGTAANEWLPAIRGGMYGLILGIVPFAALFMVTPLFGRALLYIAGSLVWFTAWTVIDALTFGYANEQGFRFLAEVNRHNFGLQAFYLAPGALEQALAVFGRMRALTTLLATSFVFILFRFGGNALSAMASNIGSSVVSAGASAGNTALDSAQRTRFLEAMANAEGTNFAAAHAGGFQGLSAGNSFMSASQASANQQVIGAFGGLNPAVGAQAGTSAQNTLEGVAGASGRAAAAGRLGTDAAGAAFATNARQTADAIGRNNASDSVQQVAHAAGVEQSLQLENAAVTQGLANTFFNGDVGALQNAVAANRQSGELGRASANAGQAAVAGFGGGLEGLTGFHAAANGQTTVAIAPGPQAAAFGQQLGLSPQAQQAFAEQGGSATFSVPTSAGLGAGGEPVAASVTIGSSGTINEGSTQFNAGVSANGPQAAQAAFGSNQALHQMARGIIGSALTDDGQVSQAEVAAGLRQAVGLMEQARGMSTSADTQERGLTEFSASGKAGLNTPKSGLGSIAGAGGEISVKGANTTSESSQVQTQSQEALIQDIAARAAGAAAAGRLDEAAVHTIDGLRKLSENLDSAQQENINEVDANSLPGGEDGQQQYPDGAPLPGAVGFVDRSRDQ